jgi:hypothetical protein
MADQCPVIPMVGLSTTETARLSGCLDRLTPHLRLNAVALTGGVGIQLGLAALGEAGTRDHVADLDLVATSLDAIAPSAVGQFLVSHRHVVQPDVPKFMVQLVDSVSRIRVDVFPDLVGSIKDARVTTIGAHRVQVLPLARILDHKLLTLSSASVNAPIDPKHVLDAQRIGAVFRKPVPPVEPEKVKPDVYGVGIDDQPCRRCDLSRDADWPLAPRARIIELLGWA